MPDGGTELRLWDRVTIVTDPRLEKDLAKLTGQPVGSIMILMPAYSLSIEALALLFNAAFAGYVGGDVHFTTGKPWRASSRTTTLTSA